MPANHAASLSFTYPDERQARIIANSIAVEVGRLDDDRTGVSVSRDESTVSVVINARDLVGLRAGINSWTRLVDVAEGVDGVAAEFDTGSGSLDNFANSGWVDTNDNYDRVDSNDNYDRVDNGDNCGGVDNDVNTDRVANDDDFDDDSSV